MTTAAKPSARTLRALDSAYPSLARVHNRLLGGKDCYMPDYCAVEALEVAAPGQRAAARRSREFQQRALRYLAGPMGVSQFLDLGAGLPSPDIMPDTHEVLHFDARGEADRATVVYVDDDPVVCAHGRALMETNEQTHYVMGDFTDPGLLLHPTVRTYLDLDQPIGVLLCGVLHHYDDSAALDIVRGWMDVVAPGSFLIFTHLYDPGEGDPLHPYAETCQDEFRRRFGTGWLRSREQIMNLFDGLNIVAPGLVAPDEWWPTGPAVGFPSVAERLQLAGVGWKPGRLPVPDYRTAQT